MKAPLCPKRFQELNVHEHKRIDPYYWLNNRENPEVIRYLQEENQFFESQMEDTKGLQSVIYEEMVGRLDKKESTVPYFKDGYYYYQRYEEGREYPVYARKRDLDIEEEDVLLNHNDLANGKAYCAVGKVGLSPNENIIAYSEDQVSRRIYTINLLDKSTRKHLVSIEGTSGGFCWSEDGDFMFYVKKDPQTLRPNRVYRHEIGTDPSQDQLMFEEMDEGFYTSVYLSKSKKFIIIHSSSFTSSEVLILPSNSPKGEFKIFAQREEGVEYSVEHHQSEFYVLTNWKATNFKVMKAPLQSTKKVNWTDWLLHREEVLIQNIEVFNNYVVLEERKNGLIQFCVMEHNQSNAHYIKMPEETYLAYVSVNVSMDAPYFRFGYTSLTTPTSIYDYAFIGRKKILKKQQEVVGGYLPEDYKSERIWAKAEDGELVPISLVYHRTAYEKGLPPLLLYGYGSYGHVVDPSFSPARLSLLDRGFVFAIAHIRGGEYLGRKWYEDGKLLKKKNTFTDFIACGKHLINEGYCAKDNLHAMGGSAGGMLMGAVINMAPSLWKSVVAAVPFVDVVTTMLDDTIPLTVGEYVEWGNPNEKVYYDYMLSYSPYDNVKEQEYPALLVTTGLHDSQVQYWEPAKWVAKLRDKKTDKHTLLLWCNMETGHGGASGRYEYYKEVAMEYAFLLKEANLF